jgi:hypothetical protein
MILDAGRWRLECDPGLTATGYASLPIGSNCDCAGCRNFTAAMGHAFPEAFRAIAQQLGVELSKPAELTPNGREPSGLHVVGGWFHLVGRILDGADAWTDMGAGSLRGALESLVPGFEFGFTSCLLLVREPFRSRPTVQLEFMTRVPWLLAEPEMS